ncbi:hypothetical protein COCSADRAFT_25820 [Bipolaris sorokiniana ND90Pr]|uniref:Carboxylesterase type B domain-containing protein n=1 Tax=Cochliobolus sativus (strain ND90Pr / ATCC 201652) TaxID=665912 RepID=M2T778_COCSN|nr:uncharacterized protein COCSADRAFT_25820 [Bipolaris sorokiniana ND90Pr]EMD64832.1 hypothetical protein COCSADRAFT_25820 [Bipolaris sorokiniana ND90Pr]
MAALLGLFSAFYLLFSARASGVLRPQSIASDLSIVTHNDLYGQASSRRAASILLSTPYTYSTARSQCAALDTTLWNPRSHAQNSAYLEYLSYAKLAGRDYLFWVDGNSTSQCTAISTHGQLEPYPCDKHLPILCSTTAASTSLPRIAVTTNNATIIGHRDDSSPSFRFFGIKYGALPARFTHSTYLPPTPASNTTALDYAPIRMQTQTSTPKTASSSTLARDKFARSIMMSNLQGMSYSAPFSNYLTIAEETKRTQALVVEVGCGQLQGEDMVQCLRKVDPWALINAKNVAASVNSLVTVFHGECLDQHSLLLDPSAPKLKQPAMMGIMHDDGSAFTCYPTTSNLSTIISSQGYPTSTILASNAFPLPDMANSALAIFNLTSRVATDAQLRCLGQSTAYTGAANRIFDKVYTYEFDRSFQLRYWSPNPPACEAPITPDHPFGNPNLPYYKCYSGDLTTVFGTVVPQGRPLRDDYDIPFSQFVLDSWTAFARTGDPNPDPAFLKARDFTNTTVMLEVQGTWGPVDVENPILKVLDIGREVV